jgi:hypothetical protein
VPPSQVMKLFFIKVTLEIEIEKNMDIKVVDTPYIVLEVNKKGHFFLLKKQKGTFLK